MGKKKKRWKATAAFWYEAAGTSLATLKRFRARKAIDIDVFIAICKAVGIEDWEQIVDKSPILPIAAPKEPIKRVESKLENLLENTINLNSLTWRFNFDHLIETHTHLFAGREEYLQKILDFINNYQNGYIFVEAYSGYGKTSLLARLVQNNPNFVYHFISQAYRSQSFNSTEFDIVLSNLCEQLEVLEARKINSNGKQSLKNRFHNLLRSSPIEVKRVIVIDAVDEIEKHPNYLRGLLPVTLPNNVFIIISARKLGDRNYLSEIGLNRNNIRLLIDLPGLDEAAITQLLSQVGGKATPLASSEIFIKQLYQVSEGDPFYIRFIVEDVSQGLITLDNINHAPANLNEYLDLQFSMLDKSAYLPQQRDIIGLILEAYAPLSRNELISMVEGLDGLNFDNVIRDIHRFLLVRDHRYTFCHNRFKEYFLSKVK